MNYCSKYKQNILECSHDDDHIIVENDYIVFIRKMLKEIEKEKGK